MNTVDIDEVGEGSEPGSLPPTTPTEIGRRVATVSERCGLPPPLPPGYRHVRRLGGGSQGTVHLATDPQGEPVAIKIVDREDSRAAQEKDRLQSLRHDHLVGFRDWIPPTAGNPHCFLVMEYIEGKPLHNLTLTTEETGLVFGQLAEALACLHQNGITHRDVKPANILVCGAGTRIKAYLVDLGVAKNHGSTAGQTRTLEFVGTPSHCAPEQLRDAKRAGAAADVFSLGVCLYQSIAKVLPYAPDRPDSNPDSAAGHDLAMVLSKQASQIECVRPRRIRAGGIPRSVDMLTRTMLHRVAERRPTSAQLPALLSRAFAGQTLPSDIRPESWASFQFRWLRRHRVLAITLSAAVGFALWAILSTHGERAANDKARQAEDARTSQHEEHRKQAEELLQADIRQLDSLLAKVQQQRYSPQSLKLQGEFIDEILARYAPLGSGLPPELRQAIGIFFCERAERQFSPTDSNLGNIGRAASDIDAAIALFEELWSAAPSRQSRLNLAKALVFRARLPTRSPNEREADLKRVVELRLAGCDPGRAEDCLRLAGAYDAFADFTLNGGRLAEALSFTDQALGWNEKAKALPEPAIQPQVTAEREISLRRKALINYRRGDPEKALAEIRPVTEVRRKRHATDSMNLRAVRDLLSALEVEINVNHALGQFAAAADLGREALKLVAQQRHFEPDNSEPDSAHLGFALLLATSLSGQQRHSQAVTILDETKQVRERLADTSPPLFRRRCADILWLRAVCLGALEKDSEALAGFEEAEAAVLEIKRRLPAGTFDLTLNALHGDVLFWQGRLLFKADKPDAAQRKLVDSATIRREVWERDRRNENALRELFDTTYLALTMKTPGYFSEKNRTQLTTLRQELLAVMALLEQFPPRLRTARAPHRVWVRRSIETCDSLLKETEPK